MGFKTDWSKYDAHSMLVKKQAKNESYPDTPLGRAIAKAMATIDAKEKAGKMKPSNAAGFRARVNGLKPLIGKDEDAGLLQAAQIIGGINRSL
jgi:hypothetical protein